MGFSRPRMLPFYAGMIASRVREARLAAGLTQAALAEAAGVSDETISRLEREAYEPAVSTLVALADALSLTVDVLIGRETSAARLPSSSPVARRLAKRVEMLDGKAQHALLLFAELLADPRGHATRANSPVEGGERAPDARKPPARSTTRPSTRKRGHSVRK